MKLAHKGTNTIINNLNPSIGNILWRLLIIVLVMVECQLKVRKIKCFSFNYFSGCNKGIGVGLSSTPVIITTFVAGIDKVIGIFGRLKVESSVSSISCFD